MPFWLGSTQISELTSNGGISSFPGNVRHKFSLIFRFRDILTVVKTGSFLGQVGLLKGTLSNATPSPLSTPTLTVSLVLWACYCAFNVANPKPSRLLHIIYLHIKLNGLHAFPTPTHILLIHLLLVHLCLLHKPREDLWLPFTASQCCPVNEPQLASHSAPTSHHSHPQRHKSSSKDCSSALLCISKTPMQSNFDTISTPRLMNKPRLTTLNG